MKFKTEKANFASCKTWSLTLRGDCKPYPHNVKLVNF